MLFSSYNSFENVVIKQTSSVYIPGDFIFNEYNGCILLIVLINFFTNYNNRVQFFTNNNFFDKKEIFQLELKYGIQIKKFNLGKICVYELNIHNFEVFLYFCLMRKNT